MNSKMTTLDTKQYTRYFRDILIKLWKTSRNWYWFKTALLLMRCRQQLVADFNEIAGSVYQCSTAAYVDVESSSCAKVVFDKRLRSTSLTFMHLQRCDAVDEVTRLSPESITELGNGVSYREYVLVSNEFCVERRSYQANLSFDTY